MIIPVRCFTCNRVLASKYNAYLKMKGSARRDKDILIGDPDKEILEQSKETREIFESLGVDRYCCKRHLLTHINLISKV